MSSNLQFNDLANAVKASYDGRDASFHSRIDYWIEYFGDRDITKIKSEDVEDGIDALIRRGKNRSINKRQDGKITPTLVNIGTELSPSSVNRYVSTLGSCFKRLKRMRLLPRGYVSPMRGVERQSEGPGRTLTVTVEDVKRLIAACRVSRNRNLSGLVAMACTTGWRLGSLQQLRWRDIDLERGTADVPRTKNGTPHRAVLLEWVVTELKQLKPARTEPNDLVFGSKDFRRSWWKALERSNLPTSWTFHHCRHIAASILAQSGASVPVIMSCLNHKTPTMALRYSHLNTDTLRENMGRAWSC